eukprot:SAG11_NODE_1240_length_5419_cov_20.037030_1_plen_502_part_00
MQNWNHHFGVGDHHASGNNTIPLGMGRGRGGPPWGGNGGHQRSTNCFRCGQPGHYARNCNAMQTIAPPTPGMPTLQQGMGMAAPTPNQGQMAAIGLAMQIQQVKAISKLTADDGGVDADADSDDDTLTTALRLMTGPPAAAATPGPATPGDFLTQLAALQKQRTARRTALKAREEKAAKDAAQRAREAQTDAQIAALTAATAQQIEVGDTMKAQLNSVASSLPSIVTNAVLQTRPRSPGMTAEEALRLPKAPRTGQLLATARPDFHAPPQRFADPNSHGRREAGAISYLGTTYRIPAGERVLVGDHYVSYNAATGQLLRTPIATLDEIPSTRARVSAAAHVPHAHAAATAKPGGTTTAAPAGDDAETDEETDEYPVREILRQRMRGGRLQYEVKWGDDAQSWERAENLDGTEALVTYKAKVASETRPFQWIADALKIPASKYPTLADAADKRYVANLQRVHARNAIEGLCHAVGVPIDDAGAALGTDVLIGRILTQIARDE